MPFFREAYKTVTQAPAAIGLGCGFAAVAGVADIFNQAGGALLSQPAQTLQNTKLDPLEIGLVSGAVFLATVYSMLHGYVAGRSNLHSENNLNRLKAIEKAQASPNP